MTQKKTDAEIVADLRQTVESCRSHYVGDWETTSLHIAAGELDRIVRIAEQGLKYRPGVVDDEWDRIIREAYADNETDADPYWDLSFAPIVRVLNLTS